MNVSLVGVFIGCVVIVFFLAWVFGQTTKKRMRQQIDAANTNFREAQSEQQRLSEIIKLQNDDLTQKNEALSLARDKEVKAERITADMGARLQILMEREKQLVPLQEKCQCLQVELAEVKSQLEAANEKLQHETQTEATMGKHFEHLARKVFEDQSSRFTAQNKESLTGLLTPFREQISAFKKQVEDAYGEENKERRSLQNEVRSLKELNRHMTEEANNLTKALKGDKKMQGNWGEMVLNRVLEESGLREGHEYEQQVSFYTSEGDRQQPDVIVHLPDNKEVIIDAKVSLVDYSRYHEATRETEREQALKAHVKAIQSHIKGLGEKNYQALEGVKTLDYVLMFIPVEPAFYAAVEYQPSLFQEALDKNIVLVSPTNLLVALKTIHHIWRYEKQSRNTQEIAKKAGSIHDKLCGLTDDMLKLGKQIEALSGTYTNSMNKFKIGKGNLIKQAKEFVDLGVKVKKELNPDLIDEALAADDTAANLSPHPRSHH